MILYIVYILYYILCILDSRKNVNKPSFNLSQHDQRERERKKNKSYILVKLVIIIEYDANYMVYYELMTTNK